MLVTEYLEKAKGETLVSFEVLPPLKGGSMKSIFAALDPLMEFKPPFIDVTYHRDELLYKRKNDGLYERIAIKKRPGTEAICASIMHHYQVDAVPHLICGGFTKDQTEYALITLSYLGINNVLALRGDARQVEDKFVPEPGGNKFASDLVAQIVAMNAGEYLDKNIDSAEKSNFCIGVAGYPEKHFESPNLDQDLMYLKEKVDAGADYIVTQMFFDNKVYFDFVEKCRAIGINVPIIPGLKPLTKRYQLNSIPRKFFLNMPEDLVKEVQAAKTSKAIKEAGVAWCVAQSQELKAAGVPCLHYYTMGDSDTIVSIIRDVV